MLIFHQRDPSHVFKPVKNPHEDTWSQEETPETEPGAAKKAVIDNLLPKFRPVALKTSGLLCSTNTTIEYKECFSSLFAYIAKYPFTRSELSFFNEICIERFFVFLLSFHPETDTRMQVDCRCKDETIYTGWTVWMKRLDMVTRRGKFHYDVRWEVY